MLAPVKTDHATSPNGGISLWYIATRAGILDRSAPWIVNYTRALIRNNKFPDPLPYYDLQGRTRDTVNLHSRWLRAAVDAWFDGLMPPHLSLVADNAAARRDAAVLDQRAAQLAGAA